jgi:acyl-CoA thioester hydrolase
MTADIFSHPVRVYFEDTDAAGIVYYANYLKFMERARTEWLRRLQVPHHALMAAQQGVFVVKDVTLQLSAPARLDDLLDVTCCITQIRAAALMLGQTVEREQTRLAASTITLVWVDGQRLAPRRLPASLLNVLPHPQSG